MADKRKRLSQMMTQSLSPSNSAMASSSIDNEIEQPNQMQQLYKQYLQPFIDERIRQMNEGTQQQNQLNDQTVQILRDRIRMGLNPELQGPRIPTVLPAEQTQAENAMGMVSGSIGGIGKAPKGSGIMPKWNSPEMFQKYLKNLQTHGKSLEEGLAGKATQGLESLPNPKQISQETVEKAPEMLDKIIKSTELTKDQKDKALALYKSYMKQAKVKGFNIPE